MIRKTKIIATAGPACKDEKILKALLLEGADIIRINASHTSAQELERWILFIRKTAASLKKTVGIMVDLQGPRVRTGKLEGGKPVILRPGQEIEILVGNQPGTASKIVTTCQPFPRMLRKGDPILLDNGTLRLGVLQAGKKKIRARVIAGGLLGENKGINLPNAPITLPALTTKDLADLALASKHKVDFIALSFVRSEEDVLVLKRWLARRKKGISVIAKIEKRGAVNHIRPILDAADGIMVARGDLGIELGVEKLPFIQKELIGHANLMAIPVITATQMLESMIEHPTPTRAEVSDVANAVFDGTDAVMLSGETAIGKYPVEAVRVMAKIIKEAEHHPGPRVSGFEHSPVTLASPVRAITHAAYNAAQDIQAKAILVFTRSGKTARLISKLRPECPIIALVPSEAISGALTLLRGVIPLALPHSHSADKMIRNADKAILTRKFLKRGDNAVMISGRQAIATARYMTKIYKVGEN